MRLGIELGLEVRKVASAHSGAGRIATLGHEARDDPVEHHTIVEAVAGEAGDPLDMARRQVGAELDHDVAAAGKGQGKGIGVGHRLVLGVGEGKAAI